MTTTDSSIIVENGGTNNSQTSVICVNYGEEEVTETVGKVSETNEARDASKNQSKEKGWYLMMQ